MEKSFQVSIRATVQINWFFLLHESHAISIHFCISLHLHMCLCCSCFLPTTFTFLYCLCYLPTTFCTPLFSPPPPSLSPFSIIHLIHPLLSVSSHTTLSSSHLSPPLSTTYCTPYSSIYILIPMFNTSMLNSFHITTLNDPLWVFNPNSPIFKKIIILLL